MRPGRGKVEAEHQLDMLSLGDSRFVAPKTDPNSLRDESKTEYRTQNTRPRPVTSMRQRREKRRQYVLLYTNKTHTDVSNSKQRVAATPRARHAVERHSIRYMPLCRRAPKNNGSSSLLPLLHAHPSQPDSSPKGPLLGPRLLGVLHHVDPPQPLAVARIKEAVCAVFAEPVALAA